MSACPHGEDTRWCQDCMDGPPPEQPRWKEVGHAFRAQFGGECPTCGRSYEQGRAIQRFDRTDGSRSVYIPLTCQLPLGDTGKAVHCSPPG